MKRFRTKWLLALVVLALIGVGGARAASGVDDSVPVPPPAAPGPQPDVCQGDDLQPPIVSAPPPVKLVATSPLGAVGTYVVTMADNCPGATLTVNPASGSVLTAGDQFVTATAVDATGLRTTAVFTVHVAGFEEQLATLGTSLAGVGRSTTLVDQVTDVQAAKSDFQTCRRLDVLMARVVRQVNVEIPFDTAITALTDIRRLEDVADCQAIAYAPSGP